MIRVFVGNNWHLIKSEIDKIVNDFTNSHGEHSVERVDGSTASYSQLINSVQSVSMFEPNKLVIVSDLSQNKKAAEKLTEIFDNVYELTEFILLETALDKRSAYYKTLKKMDGFKEFSELTEYELPKWLIGYAKEKGADISLQDCAYLIDRVGANQTLLAKEIEKLSLYSNYISRQTIDELTVANPRSTIFNLIDAAFSGNNNKAISLYEEQRMQKVEPQLIMGMLIWQMHVVAMCAFSGAKSNEQIAKESGVNSYVVGKAQNIASRMGVAKIKDFLDLLRTIEQTSRRQTYNMDDALKYAILSLNR